MTKVSSPAYLAKVKSLSKDETERLLSRMTGKLPRRLHKDKLSREEALAIQLELEDEQLHEWRKMMVELKKKESTRSASEQTKAIETTKAPAKSKSPAKVKTPDKIKTESGK